MARRSLELRQQIGQLTDELQTLVDDPVKFAAAETKLNEAEGQLARALVAEKRAAAGAQQVGGEGTVPTGEPTEAEWKRSAPAANGRW